MIWAMVTNLCNRDKQKVVMVRLDSTLVKVANRNNISKVLVKEVKQDKLQE